MEAIKIVPIDTINPTNKKVGYSASAFMSVSAKFSEINNHIEEGKEIPAELTKNFVTCNLSDDPFSEIE